MGRRWWCYPLWRGNLPVQLWLIRHAQPLVAPGVCYGALDMAADSAATALAAMQLAAALPQGLPVHYSPALRCRQLANAVHMARPDLVMHCAPDLREMHFGQWEGQRWDAIAPSELAAWTDDFENYRCGGTGECTADFVRRVLRTALHRAQPAQVVPLAAAQVSSASPVSPAMAWITHAGVVRAIAWLLQQVGPETAGQGPQTLESLAPEGRRLGLRADAWPLHAPHFGQYQRLDWTAQASAHWATRLPQAVE
jgi:alpha-ribazole phosphatase